MGHTRCVLVVSPQRVAAASGQRNGAPTILELAWARPNGPAENGAIVTDKGLREVVAADTKISDIDGEQGRLWYVGYEIEDLAAHASFEEVVYLLHNLELPTRDAARRAGCGSCASERELPSVPGAS